MSQKVKYIITLYCEIEVEPEDELDIIADGILDMVGDGVSPEIISAAIILTERDGKEITEHG